MMDATGPADHDRPEADADDEQHVAGSRATGGVEGEEEDQASTTGSTETPEFVGRIAGADIGYEEETGAERRAEG
jgi:hypothetical protein